MYLAEIKKLSDRLENMILRGFHLQLRRMSEKTILDILYCFSAQSVKIHNQHFQEPNNKKKRDSSSSYYTKLIQHFFLKTILPEEFPLLEGVKKMQIIFQT